MIEDRIPAMLRDQAEQVTPAAGLTERVVHRAGVFRRRRAVAGAASMAGVAAVAVFAVAVGTGRTAEPVPASPTWAASPSVAPSRSVAPSPSAPPSAPSSVQEDPQAAAAAAYAKLPVGGPITMLPRAETIGGRVTLVLGNGRITMPPNTSSVTLTTTPTGVLVDAHGEGFTGGAPDPDQRLYRAAGGQLTTLHSGPTEGVAANPTGTQIAVAVDQLPLDTPTEVVVYNSADSAVAARLSVPYLTRVVAWTDAGILLEEGQAWWLWQPGSDPVDVSGFDQVLPLPGRSDALLVSTEDCWSVWSVATRSSGPPLACGVLTTSVSPDSELMLAGTRVIRISDGGPMGTVALAENATSVDWEDASHLLLYIFTDKIGTSYARCDVATGTCEQAPLPTVDGPPVTRLATN